MIPHKINVSKGNLIYLLALMLFLLIAFGPFLVLLLKVIFSPAEGWSYVLPSGRRMLLLIKSAGLAGATALGGTIIGALAAAYLWTRQTGVAAKIRWLFLLSAPIPPYIHALAWSAAVQFLNRNLLLLGLPGLPLEGWLISWWVQTMSWLPLAAGLSLLGLEAVEQKYIEAARLQASDIDAWKKVILPLAAPALAAGAALLFLLTLVDYSVPSLFSVNVYPLEIFAEYSAGHDPGRALLLAAPLLVVTAAVIVLSLSAVKKAASLRLSRRYPAALFPRGPSWLRALQGSAVVILGLQLIIPLLSLTLSLGSGENIFISAAGARQEIIVSAIIAGSSALLCLPPALAAAEVLQRHSGGNRRWWLAVTLPLALPAPLVGVGLIVLWQSSFIYGSLVMPVLAALARFAPLAALLLFAQMKRQDPLLLDAARLLQTSSRQTWLRIRLPLLAPGLLAAASIVFILTAGELGATLIVAPPGRGTLTMRIYNYLHYGASGEVAGLSLLMVVMAIAAAGAAIFSLSWWRRIYLRD